MSEPASRLSAHPLDALAHILEVPKPEPIAPQRQIYVNRDLRMDLIEMLRGLGMDLMLIGANGLIPFNARAVRSDVGWYVNLFANRNPGRAAIA